MGREYVYLRDDSLQSREAMLAERYKAITDRPSTVVCWDLDSTIRHTKHRWHLSPSEDPNSDWPTYAQACGDDTPIAGPIAAMRLHYRQHQNHIVSGADISSLPMTVDWLKLHRAPYDRVTLNDNPPEMKNSQIKINYIRKVEAEGLTVVLFYEDHPHVAEKIYEETGVPVVLVNPNYHPIAEGTPAL